MEFQTDIPLHNLLWLEAKIEGLNRRAVKLGVPAISLVCGEPFDRELGKDCMGIMRKIRMVPVTVSGESPKLDGWRLVAKAEYADNGEIMLRCVPGEDCPIRYRTTDYHCDHCGHQRQRSAVFIVGHDSGDYKQVGRQCLGDFLGGASPEYLCTWAGIVCDLAEEATSDKDYFGGSRGEYSAPIGEFVTTVAVVIRRLGWIAKSAAIDGRSTASTAWWLSIPTFSNQEREAKAKFVRDNSLAADERDIKLAENSLVWAAGLSRVDSSDYLYNLGVACRQETVMCKTCGIVASVISAYQRALERDVKPVPVSAHVGEVGKRLEFTLTCDSLRYFDGPYGVKTLCQFSDSSGNRLTWWSSGKSDWLREGHTFKVKGTVSKHGEYRGQKQTELKRVSPVT